MRKIRKYLLIVISVFTALLFSSCGAKETIGNYSVTIDVPSEANLPMPTGRSFYVSGSIAGDSALPEGAVVEIDMLDQDKNVIRHTAGTREISHKYYVYPEMVQSFSSDMKEIYANMEKYARPEYLVADAADPDASFHNAEIKCFVDDSSYTAFIAGGTDEQHGAAVDDGCHYTDAKGAPYTAFSEGEYTFKVSLKDKNGTVLAAAEKAIVIGDPENALIMRFHPDRYLDEMLEKIGQIVNYQTNIDNVPGYFPGMDDHAGGRTMLFKANDMTLYRNARTYLMTYMIDPTSSSWRVELPYLCFRKTIDDPERFVSLYFNIGEPVLKTGNETIHGEILAFEPGDRHEICRIDYVDSGAHENVFDMENTVEKTITDVKDSTVSIDTDKGFAVMGVVAPACLDDCVVFDQYHDNIEITNRIETLKYEFTDGNSVLAYEKPVYLSRKHVEETDGNYDSVLEYYHIFSASDFETGKVYEATSKGYDKNGKEVAGTEEKFSIRFD